MAVHELTPQQARRIAVRAQLLTARRPTDLVDLVRHLTFLQIDPTAAIAPTADLVAWTRLGSGYRPADLVAALESHTLVEIVALIRPAEDIALYRGRMLAARADPHPWVVANDACRRDILARLAADGPVTSRELPDSCEVGWKSTGWTNNRNVTKLLEFMSAHGEVAVTGRQGRQRVWDLAERVYPDVPTLPVEEADARINARRLTALGIARARTTQYPVEPADVGAAGEPAVVAGVKGEWRVDPTLLDDAFEPRTALLSPFDRLIHERRRNQELFDFEYQLEMYKPAAKRRWGYYALPILHGDALVGKLDATVERDTGRLRVNAVHRDVPFDRATASAVDAEITALADWRGLTVRR